MSNRIILVYHNYKGLDVCEQATNAIRSISPSKSFDFEKVSLNINNLQNPESVFDALKRGDAILFCGFNQSTDIDARFLLAIQKNFNLYSTSQHYKDITLVYDGYGGIYHGKKGFDTNKTFGREAYDVASYGELEIERTARIAYEIAENGNRKLLLADRADALATSALWRKIVTDINEDYPFVNTNCKYVEEVLHTLLNHDTNTACNNDTSVCTSTCNGDSETVNNNTPPNAYGTNDNLNGVILTSNVYGNILNTVCKSRFNFEYTMFAGDTPFAGYICTSDTSANSYRNMLTFSFGEI